MKRPVIKHWLISFFVCTLIINYKNCGAQIITTIAGTSSHGFSGDGGPATNAVLNYPTDVLADGQGNIFIADDHNNRIRKINSTGIITTIAGNGSGAYAGDGGQATNASLSGPYAIALDNAGNLFIADYLNNCIRKVSTSGIITTVAGNTTYGYSGDGGSATAAGISQPNGIAVDRWGNIYITSVPDNRVRKVNTAGIITTFAGSASGGFGGDGGPATAASFNDPVGVAVDTSGNVYIMDAGNNRVRKVNTSGIITTVAGTAGIGFSGDGGPATAAHMASPQGIALDDKGNIYFPDYANQRIRKVTASTGIINTIAGNGFGAGTTSGGYSGDAGPATAAELNNPEGVGVDKNYNVYISDYYNHRIRKVTALPVASFIPGIDTICMDSCTTLINTGTGSLDSMTWSIPGLPVAEKHKDTVNVCFHTTGNDTVRLYLYNISGSDTSKRVIYVKACNTGIKTIEPEDIKIFPNPAYNEVTIEYAPNGTSVNIYNILGKLVCSNIIQHGRQTIDLTNIEPAIYLIEITDTSGNRVIRTIIKQ